ncbi:MAG TPA: hypothetical protein DCY25_05820 [Bacteroidales bacterium]|nr:hypothetical protein [Bacteroidales bacterium]
MAFIGSGLKIFLAGLETTIESCAGKTAGTQKNNAMRIIFISLIVLKTSRIRIFSRGGRDRSDKYNYFQ